MAANGMRLQVVTILAVSQHIMNLCVDFKNSLGDETHQG
jgi:hypothetical protein